MSTEKNNDIVRKRQDDIDAKKTTTTSAAKVKTAEKNNEIEETLNTVSYKEVKESKEEVKILGDSDKE